ncbi:hypothetical protein GJ496_003643 [Pomphorhynchus laevis]|nr:hypothetical protein GJ496_003643 [Pomphorhynchus laevis]
MIEEQPVGYWKKFNDDLCKEFPLQLCQFPDYQSDNYSSIGSRESTLTSMCTSDVSSFSDSTENTQGEIEIVCENSNECLFLSKHLLQVISGTNGWPNTVTFNSLSKSQVANFLEFVYPNSNGTLCLKNIGIVLHLSCFFQIKILINFCLKFIERYIHSVVWIGKKKRFRTAGVLVQFDNRVRLPLFKSAVEQAVFWLNTIYAVPSVRHHKVVDDLIDILALCPLNYIETFADYKELQLQLKANIMEGRVQILESIEEQLTSSSLIM